MASLRTGLSSSKICQNSVNTYSASFAPIRVRPCSLRHNLKLAFPCSPFCCIYWNKHTGLCTNHGSWMQQPKHALCLEPQLCGQCRPRVKRVHPTEGHQNPRTHHLASINPSAQAGSCPKYYRGKTEDTNQRTRLSKYRTLSSTIFGRVLFLQLFVPHSLSNRTYSFQNFYIIVCQEMCQCTK